MLGGDFHSRTAASMYDHIRREINLPDGDPSEWRCCLAESLKRGTSCAGLSSRRTATTAARLHAHVRRQAVH